jgi:hypothetical protein
MTIRRLIYLFIATACLLLQTACQFEDDGQCADNTNVGDSYISLTVTVSNGDTHARTRANTPAGGEDGDGREAGFERENTVTGITLILYRDPAGINTSSDPTLELVRYFPVTERAAGTSPIEVTYTTGSQPLGKHNLSLSTTYHAIVIANYDMTSYLTEGTSKLSNIKNATLNAIYAGNPTNSADDCTHFVMSSERDCTINFGSVTAKNLDGTTPHTKGQDMLYDLRDQPIVIERMAARIDFWSKNSNGYKTSEDNAAYTIPGYEYDVTSSTDKFVVTGIVPFNLTNGHATYGSEYLIKRLRTDVADVSTSTYLADETTTSYVIDPKTDDKLTDITPSLTSSLGSVYTLIDDASKLENTSDNPYYHSVASMHGLTTASSTIDSKENVIVCYPMENCLLPESKLYYHATGIAIVGYYYQNGTGTGVRKVYLSYLRHQGEAENYDILPSTTQLSNTATMGTTTPMNFGVVRNNIYRISIESVSSMTFSGSIRIKIEETKWRHVDNPEIYI